MLILPCSLVHSSNKNILFAVNFYTDLSKILNLLDLTYISLIQEGFHQTKFAWDSEIGVERDSLISPGTAFIANGSSGMFAYRQIFHWRTFQYVHIDENEDKVL